MSCFFVIKLDRWIFKNATIFFEWTPGGWSCNQNVVAVVRGQAHAAATAALLHADTA